MTPQPTLDAIQAMREVLIASGFHMYYECGKPCLKEQYNHEDHDYEVVIKKNQSIAWITLMGQTIDGPFAGYLLEEKLKRYIR